MKRFLCMILAMGLVFMTIPYEVKAGERVIYSLKQLSEHTGRITLSFQDSKVTENIQITGYSIVNNDKHKIKVSYVTGSEARANQPSTYLNQVEYPLKIQLEEAKKSQGKMNDLPKNEELRDHILHLYDRGVINGRPDGSFGAEENISRAEVATLITLAAGYPIDTSRMDSPFPDMKGDHWAMKYILPLSERGILVGNENKEFQPGAKITIGAIIRMIDATFEIQLDKQGIFESPVKNDWSTPFYISLMEKGLVHQTDAFVLPYDSTRLATRGEVATLISRALENLHTIK